MAKANAETGDLPYHGPEPQICRKHTQALVGEGCPACYREWSEAQSAAPVEEDDTGVPPRSAAEVLAAAYAQFPTRPSAA